MMASMHSMHAERSPAFSSAATPQIVVPFGEHTASFKTPGCCPVTCISFALPSTVCAIRRYAVARERPYLTPASAYASMNMSTNAGPHPLMTPPIPMSSDGSTSTMPSPSNSFFITASSSSHSEHWSSKRNTPSPTIAGVLGITHCTRTKFASPGVIATPIFCQIS